MDPQDKANIIASKYSKKYTENINGGKINYHSVVDDEDNSSLIPLVKGVRNIQEHLKKDERTIIFVTDKDYHTKSLIVTKDYCFINHNDRMQPCVEDALIAGGIKLVPVVPFFKGGIIKSYLQCGIIESYLHSDHVCVTTSAKTAKHVAFLSDEKLYDMIQKNNSKKNNVVQNDIIMDLGYFTPQGCYAQNKMEYWLKLTPDLAANIAKYSQMGRFESQISQFYGFGQDFKDRLLNTKITGNKGNNEGLTLNNYIQKNTCDARRTKLNTENKKYENTSTDNSVENQTPTEFFVSTQKLSKNVDNLPIINSAIPKQPLTTNSHNANQGTTASSNSSMVNRQILKRKQRNGDIIL